MEIIRKVSQERIMRILFTAVKAITTFLVEMVMILSMVRMVMILSPEGMEQIPSSEEKVMIS